jgi:predicted transcriptional regulator
MMSEYDVAPQYLQFRKTFVFNMEEQTEKPARHGLPWSEDDVFTMKRAFLNGFSLSKMAAVLMRKKSGVLPKLEQHGLIVPSKEGHVQCRYLRDEILLPTKQPEGIKMAFEDMGNSKTSGSGSVGFKPVDRPAIQTLTLIYGQDASTMSNDQIFTAIGHIEAEITRLEAIKAKSKKLAQTVENYRKDIEALVKYVDGRP